VACSGVLVAEDTYKRQCAVVRQGCLIKTRGLIAVIQAFLMGCALVLVVAVQEGARKLRKRRSRDTLKPPRSKDAQLKQHPKKTDVRGHEPSSAPWVRFLVRTLR
jgi:hypothetical protein